MNINKNIKQQLNKLGWTEFFDNNLKNIDKQELSPGRVIEVNRNSQIINDGSRELRVTTAGSFNIRTDGIYPVTGDWVLFKDTLIHDVLKRKNTLSRGAAGTRFKSDSNPRTEQIIAANLDRVFIVSGLDRDFNHRRIERYLTLVNNCGLSPVIILTKGDLHEHPEQYAQQLETIAVDVPIHIVSTDDPDSLEILRTYLIPDFTISLIGSSGAGKSTLVNRLAGDELQVTGALSRSLGKGMHTTSTRSLLKIPGGGMIIDNPGTREITLLGDDGGLETTFPEIDQFAGLCRFANCNHSHEPGCKVLEAADNGSLQPERLISYQKMRRELDFTIQKEYKTPGRIEKERWQKIAKKGKAISKLRRR